MSAMFSELDGAGLISVSGADAAAFLHAQFTSDVAGTPPMRTHYSGYCSPKGRLLATLLVWRAGDGFFLQLPGALREAIQARLAKYVLRARVTLADATSAFRIVAVWGGDAPAAVESVSGPAPQAVHEIAAAGETLVTRLALDRYLALLPAGKAAATRAALVSRAQAQPETAWARLEIASGVPVITSATQEQFVPQMVNLDLIGALSYAKGCYPGQEIVARTHYLGRLKQRMHRVHVPSADAPAPGDPLYSEAFGPEQASGTIVNAAPADTGYDALAVLQVSAVPGIVHWGSPEGPAVQFEPLPYPVSH